MNPPLFGSTFRRTLKSLLVNAGWQLDVLDDELSHDASGLVLEFISGHAVRLRRPDGSGPVVSSRAREHENAAYDVSNQVHLIVTRATHGRAQVAPPADEAMGDTLSQ